MQVFDHQNPETWLHGIDNSSAPLKVIMSPSLLACDFARLLEECHSVLSEDGGASEWLHVDVMDGHFVPNISIGAVVVESLRRHLPHAFLDCHLMVSRPEQWVADFAKAGASQYTFHVEATEDAMAMCASIRAAKMQCGVAIKPQTPASSVFALCDANVVDMVLVMTVEPGFGGQSFMAAMMPKVQELRERYPGLNIQVDGGLSPSNVDVAAAAGANVIVAGTSVFRAPSRKDATQRMRDAVAQHLNSASIK